MKSNRLINTRSLQMGTASTSQQSSHTRESLPSPSAPSASKDRTQDAKFLQRVLYSSPDCIKVLDLQGRLLYMNHEGQRIMEIDDFIAQVQHQAWLSFWQGEDQAAAKVAFAQALAGKTGRFDGYCATAKGSPRWWEVVVSPILDDDHQIHEILSVSRDITARKQAELAIEQRNQELDSFASIVSHDLKAPLRGINSLSSWIVEDMEGDIPAQVEAHLEQLQQQVTKMDSFINGLLEVSRVGREELSEEEIDTAELLSEVIDFIALPAGFSVNAATPLPKLRAKRLLLNQVMSNLIGNAIKHHDKETGKIEIAVSGQGHQYEFSITDDGPGIPPAYHERIFEMFQTLDNKQTTNTGIGLALVKKIIEGEGGKLWLDEKTKAGCKFCFTWPKSQCSSYETAA